ncbi:MAG: peptidase M48 Ste24p [Gammaproteobacteria bacterium]|nr:MAG: peptidase M48 Ste24p [Gammaproteobacteria bacterium]
MMGKSGKMDRREFLGLLGLSGGGLLLGWLGGCAVDPVTGRQSMVMLSERQEVEIDRRQAPHIFSADYGEVGNPVIRRYLEEVGRRLVRVSHRPDRPYTFHAVNAVHMNAYSLPGGTVAVTRGMLVELSSEAELAALLGHEIAHVTARHAAERAAQGALANIFLAGVGALLDSGGAGRLVQDFGSLGAGALLAHYSREDEREADALGMEYMVRAGYNPEGMVALTRILVEKGRERPDLFAQMFASHPPGEERLQTALRLAAERYASARGRPLLRERYLEHLFPLLRIRRAIHIMQDGLELMSKRRYREAENAFASALAQVPDDYAGLLMMAKVQLAQNRPEQARRFIDRARRANPTEAQAVGLSGVTWLMLDRPREALQDFVAYERMLPGNPDIVFFQGLALERMGRSREAAAAYQRYLNSGARGRKARHAWQRLKEWGYL